MAKDALTIAITGHIDHGKSTLIGRLLLDTNSLPKDKIAELNRIAKELGKDAELAFLTDQLKEEREQDKTIDTTQTFFHTGKRDFVIIDTPGHKEFLRNMLTGASMAEAAVLIVDTHEGIMEQTRRHAYLISLLGINKLVVVLNKMDLSQYSREVFERIRAELGPFFDELKLKPLCFIPISARGGINIARKSKETGWYKGPSLIEALESIKIRDTSLQKPLRFPVQDVYEINGEKILVGAVSSGRLFEGEEISLSPDGKKSTIASIRSFGTTKKEAVEGENIGITLTDNVPARRGLMVSDALSPAVATYTFSGEIFWLSNVPIQKDSKAMLRVATQETEFHISDIRSRTNSSTLDIIEEDAKEIGENEVGNVTIKTAHPIVVEDFAFVESLGRFVIERDGEMLGAGIVRSGP